MEPEDLLAAGDDEPGAGAEELRAIVARAQRRRWRVGVGGLTAALLIGGGVGYAVSNHHSAGQSVTTAAASGSKAGRSSPSGQTPGPAVAGESGSSSSSAVSTPAMFPERLQPLFTRTAGSVDIRGFLMSSTIRLPQGYATPSCAIYAPRFEAEVSTPKMVGTAEAGFVTPDPTEALSDVNATILGVAEGDPTLVVTAYAGKGVAEVRVTGFSGGATDSMVPVSGWVALGGPTAASSASVTSPVTVGTITALNASGQVMSSQTVTVPTPFAGAPVPLSSAAAQAANGASVVCMGGASGTGTSGTGTSGTGTSGPGKSTGTLHVTCPSASVPPVVPPGAAGGGVQSNTSSGGTSVNCAVHIEPAITGAGNKAAG